jgi:hypothetical protein
MYAIAKAESGLNAGNKGYNCYYERGTDRLLTGEEAMKLAKDKRYSGACKTEAHRSKAWSTDCGILQINVIGKICPVELFDVDNNLKAGKGKLDRQGLGAWVTHNNGDHVKHLTKN